MLITELTGSIRNWASAEADAKSRGLELLKQQYVKGYLLRPINYDQIVNKLKAQGISWHEYRDIISKDLSRITDYKKAADALEKNVGSIPQIIASIKDNIKSKAYDELQRQQEYGTKTWPHGHLQLFMPRPEIHTKKPPWAYTNYDKNGDPLSEARPILTGKTANSPPGGNKPSGAFWSSSAIKKGSEYTSDWVDYVCGNMPNWYNEIGYVYKISPNAKILRLDDDHDAINIINLYNQLTDKNISLDNTDPYELRKEFPWNEIQKHWDGVSHRPGHGDRYGFTYGWDCESTAWFNTDVLEFVGKVKIQSCDSRNDDDY